MNQPNLAPPKLLTGHPLCGGIWFAPQTPLVLMLQTCSGDSPPLEFLGGALVVFPSPQRLDCRQTSGFALSLRGDCLCNFQFQQPEPNKSKPSSNARAHRLEIWWNGQFHQANIAQLKTFQLPRSALHIRAPIRQYRPEKVPKPGAFEDQPSDLASFEPTQTPKSFDPRSWKGVPAAGESLKKLIQSMQAKRSASRLDKGPDPKANSLSSSSGAGPIDQIIQSAQQIVAPILQKTSDFLRSYYDQANREYLRRMVALFERGNWEEALRMGVPIQGEGSAQFIETLGLFRPRSSLQFSSFLGFGSTTGVGDTFYAHITRLYEKAFQELDQAARHFEAAFVLAELLGSSLRAVLYLEEKGLYREASELAEAKQLEPPLRVRLLFRAGQIPKALEVARSFGLFAQTYLELKEKDPSAAKKWLELWAGDLADLGDFAKALLLSHHYQGDWSLLDFWLKNQEPPREPTWLFELAFAEGSATSGHLMALCLNLPQEPAQRELHNRYLLQWEAQAEEGCPAYFGLAEKLAQPLDCTPPVLHWRSRLCRQLLTLYDQGLQSTSTTLIKALGHQGDDLFLAVDLPYLPEIGSASGATWEETVSSCGQTTIYDVALLCDGRKLVALGEAGLMLLDRTGEVIFRYSLPVHHIIRPLKGQVYLLLSDRGAAKSGRYQTIYRYRPYKVDADSGQPSEPVRLCSTQLDSWAAEHDGHRWLVFEGQQLRYLDIASHHLVLLNSATLQGCSEVYQIHLGRFQSRPHLHAPKPSALPNQPFASNQALQGYVLTNNLKEPMIRCHRIELPSLKTIELGSAKSASLLWGHHPIELALDPNRSGMRVKFTQERNWIACPFSCPLAGNPQLRAVHQQERSAFILDIPDPFAQVGTAEGASRICVVCWKRRVQLASFYFPMVQNLNAQWVGSKLLLYDGQGRILQANLEQLWWDFIHLI